MIVCPAQPAPANGAVSYPNGRNLDDRLVYTCNAGYVIQGTTSRQCQSTGQWTSATATCARENKFSTIVRFRVQYQFVAQRGLILQGLTGKSRQV